MPCATSSARSTSAAASSSAKARWTRARCSTSARRSASATAPRSTSPSTRWRARPSAPRPCRTRWPCWPSPSAAACCNAPDMYMDKIAIGPGYPDGIIDLDAPPGDNVNALAKAKGVPVSRDHRLHARPAAPCRAHRRRARGRRRRAAHPRRRHRRRDLDDRSAGDRHRHLPRLGGAPEGVLAAAALRCIGGQMQGRLHPLHPRRRRSDRARRQDGHHRHHSASIACTRWRPAT